MKKENPKVFAAKIDKKLNNNAKYSITRNDEEVINQEKNFKSYEKSIDQKIRDIFNSNNYKYIRKK